MKKYTLSEAKEILDNEPCCTCGHFSDCAQVQYWDKLNKIKMKKEKKLTQKEVKRRGMIYKIPKNLFKENICIFDDVINNKIKEK